MKHLNDESNEEIEFLEWDSNFFNIRVGRVYSSLKKIDLTKVSNFDLIYIHSTVLLENSTIPLYDKKVTFEKNITLTEKALDNSYVVKYDGGLTKELKDLAIASGTYSRFKLDSKLSNRFEEFFTLWIKNSLHGKLADFVYVYIKDNKIIGFISLKKNDSYYQIGLIATSALHRGLGIGSALLQKAEEVAKSEKISKIIVVTQLDNNIACNFYKKNGYQIKSTEYIYHHWLT
ncbi:GNAT family N-acetyltransferase [Aquimarina sp. 2201CG14-23]|uniref:GNAT family N-acetyltransferase n=1 Tax=Aquimarina mycalae TaxID=3040073 RepID=UPI002477EE2B|nr:GNAT family N-acetyltransferase [Aquimarina sp. 2201CG14-23]MDH7445052.1 GNAT family N-acetyltransferase [Aquimarina sp. 2201CG14-23]